MPTVLIVWHSRTGASAALAAAARDGTKSCAATITIMLRADLTDIGDLAGADGYLFIGPENLGGLSGAMKEMLDRSYYPLLGQIEGRPYAHIVAAGSDGAGAARQLARIVTGWRLRAVADPLIIPMDAQTPEAILADKVVPDHWLKRAHETGAALANGLAMGIF